jgi:hypothetical protein
MVLEKVRSGDLCGDSLKDAGPLFMTMVMCPAVKSVFVLASFPSDVSSESSVPTPTDSVYYSRLSVCSEILTTDS